MTQTWTPELKDGIKELLRDVDGFVEFVSGLKLRAYQRGVARCIVDSIIHRRGRTFIVIFPRQSGKNELQAQLEAYLLTLYSQVGGEMVKVSPTWKPQSLNAMQRLERVLKNNPITQSLWKKESGYIYSVGKARLTFLSASPTTHIVGATASLLLECDEAQDVLSEKFDKEVNPMAASTNATRVLWGTAWTSKTLLARELRAARRAEQHDGERRVFLLNADDVRQEAPEYGAFVDEQIARLGAEHPFVKTQFFSQEIDGESGLFTPQRQALMQGSHPAQSQPQPGQVYAFLLDVAGQDEGGDHWASYLQGASGEGAGSAAQLLANPRRDATALTIVSADLSHWSALRAPIYRVVARRLWLGERHVNLFGQLLSLVEGWQPRYVVVDCTGVGAGLASFLERALGAARLLPFTFTSASKSRLGWDFLGVVETGRFRDYTDSDPLKQAFWEQVQACEMEVLEGAGQVLRWGVPDGTRHPTSGELLHDDLLISAALCAVLDERPWGVAESALVRPPDPFGGMGEVY